MANYGMNGSVYPDPPYVNAPDPWKGHTCGECYRFNEECGVCVCVCRDAEFYVETVRAIDDACEVFTTEKNFVD